MGKQQYAMTPEGKRAVRCGCNSEYLRDDPATECFEDMDACTVCGKYPWYTKKAVNGGSAIKYKGGNSGKL